MWVREWIIILGIQGKKGYQEKLFNNFQFSDRIPKNNFYRRLKGAIDLDFLYPLTKGYYGESGQKSIDPVVFFKLCLVGYLENIISDRKLIDHCSMRLDILYFIGYDIDEELPWHSTISRTRQLFPEAVFVEVFTKVLAMCVEKGMVSGHTQAIDSAPVKANASMDTLELKVPQEDPDAHLRKVRALSAMDKGEPHRKSKGDRSDKGQRSVTANKKELYAIKGRNKKWAKDQDQRPGAGNKGSKYTSNKGAFLSQFSSDAGQSHGPRCTDKHQAREGAQAELPEPAQRGYGKPCNNRHQGLSCRWQGQPTASRYRQEAERTLVTTGADMGELRGRHGLQ